MNLGTDGQASAVVPAIHGGSYYVTVKHRNSIETTTAAPVSFSPATISYSFDAPLKAYGGNLRHMSDGQYAIYGGDVNQDGSVDTGDMTPVDNDVASFATGYLPSDVNGDGTVDTADMTIVDNNTALFVNSATP